MTRQTDVRMDGGRDILYYYSRDLTQWPAAAYDTRNYELRFYNHQKSTQTTRQREIDTFRQTYDIN